MNTIVEMTQRNLQEMCLAALKDFCDGYRWMFEKNIKRALLSAETLVTGDLTSGKTAVMAVNTIIYAGKDCGQGAFQIILEKDAVFSLGGLTVMMPLVQIKENCVTASEESVGKLEDAVSEVGNLLTGAFGKIFRAGCSGVEGFGDDLLMKLILPVKLGLIGIPELDGVDKVHVFNFQLSLDGLPPFGLKIVFPATV